MTAVEPVAANDQPAVGSPERRLDSLTGLRFVAAFLVFGFHVHIERIVPGASGAALEWIFGQGAVGVSFFFILSGFVLTWSVRSTDTVGRFWRRRFAKVYPNHVATWLVTLAVILVGGGGVATAVWLPNLLLVQAWWPGFEVFFGMNTVSWSLACEVFFYALFPALHPALRRLPRYWLWPATVGTLAAVWLVPVAASVLPADDRYWAIWVFPVARLPEFVAGMLLARIVREGLWPPLGVRTATALAVAAYLTSRWLPGDFRMVAGTAIPLALLVAAVGAADAAGARTPWRSRWAVTLGEMSFAFYLVHQLAIRFLLQVTDRPQSAVAGTAVALSALAVALAASWLLFRAVELPGMRLLRPRSRSRDK